ncbi:MAG TPA: CocE/NonD family hydrolase [Bryobacteraceae bacterium]|nr:CocE/NonD family hydrolase [Bryobacteraceae bacterium]
MRIFSSSLLWLALTVVACAQPYRVAVQNGVSAKMRDGVVLIADVYHPEGNGKYPVLVERTPYNRAGGAGTAVEMAEQGYVVVIQDTRGRFDSQGEFYPFRFESQDGYDTVEWAASLPNSNGQVGMFGGSYVGATQMLTAIAKPPHLKAIFPYVTASEYYEGWTYQGGALMQWFASSWSAGLVNDTLRRKSAALSDSKRWIGALPIEGFRMLELPPVSTLAPYYADWVAHERDDSYWKPWKISDHYPEMNVKALHSGGWHDIFLKGTINNYMGMRKSSPAKAEQRLLLGPWAHAVTSPEGKIGDVTFGKDAVLDMTGTTIRWFDYALKGKHNEYATGAPVRIFVMGENRWRSEQEFPLARTRYTNYYLRSGHLLSTDAPAGEGPENYDYDPADPVPTIGGRLCCGNNQLPPGPADERPNEKRSDVLIFSTPPLARDTEVTGLIRAKIYASTSAADTDFTALLVDVEPSGYARFLTDGILRARYRNSTQKAEPVEPGKVYAYDIDLWATSNVFKAGHRIRLYVSSSNFPRFNRNLNTGEPNLSSTRMVKARQTIYHDAQHPSALVLPLVPRQ